MYLAECTLIKCWWRLTWYLPQNEHDLVSMSSSGLSSSKSLIGSHRSLIVERLIVCSATITFCGYNYGKTIRTFWAEAHDLEGGNIGVKNCELAPEQPDAASVLFVDLVFEMSRSWFAFEASAANWEKSGAKRGLDRCERLGDIIFWRALTGS